MVSKLDWVNSTTTTSLHKSDSAFDPFRLEDEANEEHHEKLHPKELRRSYEKDDHHHNRAKAKKSLDNKLKPFETMLEGDTPWTKFGKHTNPKIDDDDENDDHDDNNVADGVLKSSHKLGNEDVFGEHLADVDLWESSPQPCGSTRKKGEARRGTKPKKGSTRSPPKAKNRKKGSAIPPPPSSDTPSSTHTKSSRSPRQSSTNPAPDHHRRRSPSPKRRNRSITRDRSPISPRRQKSPSSQRRNRSKSKDRSQVSPRHRKGSPSPKRRNRSTSRDRSPLKPVRKSSGGHRSKSGDKHKRRQRSKSRDAKDDPSHKQRSNSLQHPLSQSTHSHKPVKRTQSATMETDRERKPPQRATSARETPQQQLLHQSNSGLLRRTNPSIRKTHASEDKVRSLEPEDLWSAILRDQQERSASRTASSSGDAPARRSYLNNKYYPGTHHRTGKGERKDSVKTSLSIFLESEDGWETFGGDTEAWDAFGLSGEDQEDGFGPSRVGNGGNWSVAGKTVASAPVVSSTKPRKKHGSRGRKNGRLTPNDHHPHRKSTGLDSHMRQTRRSGEPGEERSVVSAPAMTAQWCHKMKLEF